MIYCIKHISHKTTSFPLNARTFVVLLKISLLPVTQETQQNLFSKESSKQGHDAD